MYENKIDHCMLDVEIALARDEDEETELSAETMAALYELICIMFRLCYFCGYIASCFMKLRELLHKQMLPIKNVYFLYFNLKKLKLVG
jgi:hypothetical protein